MSKISEPCSPKLRACIDDLIAQGKPESSAWAIYKAQLNEKLREAKTANVCGTCDWIEDDPKQPVETCPLCGAKAYYVPILHPKESFVGTKHPDFQKIQSQFIKQFGQQEGSDRYSTWINKLGLDETISYMNNQQMREKFQWVKKHVDFELWKEDTEAKYWQVEVGFPLESMNGNVYTLQENQESARTLAHKSVNLNHKFTLSTIDIPAAQFEGGIVEAIIRVPKTLKCPICDKDKTINDLIESGKIVNVSLEAACTLKSDIPGKCEGQEFTGLSLLTIDVLPGIPLTRLMPLEAIMVEALQTDETKTEVKSKVKKLEMKIVTEPKEADYPWDQCISDMKAQGYDDDSAPKACAAIKNRTVSHAMLYGFATTQKEAIDYVLKKYREDKLFAYELDKFVKEQKPRTDEERTKVHFNIADEEWSKLSQEQKQAYVDKLPPRGTAEQSCPEGQHFDEGTGQCVPDFQQNDAKPTTELGTSPAPKEEIVEPTQLEEKVNRIKAEIKAKTAEEQAVIWEKQFTDLDQKHHELLGKNAEQEKTVQDLRKEAKDLNEKRLKLDGDLREEQRETGNLHGQIREMQKNMDELKTNHDELGKKYNNAVGINLELSKKLTKANEDYLEIASKNELLEAALKRSQIQAKKIIRIKA